MFILSLEQQFWNSILSIYIPWYPVIAAFVLLHSPCLWGCHVKSPGNTIPIGSLGSRGRGRCLARTTMPKLPKFPSSPPKSGQEKRCTKWCPQFATVIQPWKMCFMLFLGTTKMFFPWILNDFDVSLETHLCKHVFIFAFWKATNEWPVTFGRYHGDHQGWLGMHRLTPNRHGDWGSHREPSQAFHFVWLADPKCPKAPSGVLFPSSVLFCQQPPKLSHSRVGFHPDFSSKSMPSCRCPINY